MPPTSPFSSTPNTGARPTQRASKLYIIRNELAVLGRYGTAEIRKDEVVKSANFNVGLRGGGWARMGLTNKRVVGRVSGMSAEAVVLGMNVGRWSVCWN